jgi:hypothetical protein
MDTRHKPARAARVAMGVALGAGICAVATALHVPARGESRITARMPGGSGGVATGASLRFEVIVPPTLVVVGEPGGLRVTGNRGAWMAGCVVAAGPCGPAAGSGAGPPSTGTATPGAAIADP